MATKLSDLHYALLTNAAERANGNILPPPASIEALPSGLTRAINTLIKRGLVAEIDAQDEIGIWRVDGDYKLVAIITEAGRTAIQSPGKEPMTKHTPQPATAEPAAAATDKPRTKQALVIEMLQRKEGSTISQLTEATSWLPHTTRAALTGLRKKGHVITATKVDGASVYRIRAAA